MRIFVAGATGVIGRRTIPLLIDAGHEVTAVARSRAPQLRSAGASPVAVDLFDADAITTAVAGHDAVINLATRIPRSDRAFLPSAWRENDRIRREASWNLVRAALSAEAQCFIQESVTLGYVDGGAAWLDEQTEWRPLPHVRSATDAEAAVQHFTKHGGRGIVLRFALFYGPDSSHTLDTIRFARKRIAASFGPADGFISSIMTDDAARAVVAALDAPAGTYNIADDEPVTRREYFDLLAAALGSARPRLAPAWLARLAGSVGKTLARSHRISSAKFAQATGWRPTVRGVEQGWVEVVRAAEQS